jgi:hypothetical protein
MAAPAPLPLNLRSIEPTGQDYQCNRCKEPFRGPTRIGEDFHCPHCDSPPPFAVMVHLNPAHAESSASLTLTTDQVLDAQRLTVLGVLSTVGLSVGLALGFGIGGWQGALVGVVSGVMVPLGLAEAFRRRPSRLWLARVADWAIDRPNLPRQ